MVQISSCETKWIRHTWSEKPLLVAELEGAVTGRGEGGGYSGASGERGLGISVSVRGKLDVCGKTWKDQEGKKGREGLFPPWPWFVHTI